MKFRMQGVYTALITPFTQTGQVCEKTLISLLQFQKESGVDAVVVLGTTGESATLDDAERDFIITCAVGQLKGKVPVVVGCGSPSTKKTIEQAKKAQSLGADALQVVTPYYNKPTQEGILLHFQAVCEATSLPVCIYNIPSRTGQNIELATSLKLAELPNVIGFKECSGNFQQITDMVEQICHKNPAISLFSGDDPMTLAMMAVGAHGVMSVLSNVAPKAVKRLVQAMLDNDIALAKAMHYALKPLFQVLFIETNPSPVKYLMKLANLDAGYLRLPLCPVSKVSQEKLDFAFNATASIFEQELIANEVLR